jgi:hypothetical protein
MGKVRKLAMRGVMLAAEHLGKRALERGSLGDLSLGLVPSEHRENVKVASNAARKAAAEAKLALDSGNCNGAYEAMGASRAFATVAMAETLDAGAPSASRAEARKAVNAARRATEAVKEACMVVPRKGLRPREARPEPRELPANMPAPAQLQGRRRRRIRR